MSYHQEQSTAIIIAAIGERGDTDPRLTLCTPNELPAIVGGKFRGRTLDAQTAVYYDDDRQTATLLDPCALNGTIALCGYDSDGNPATLSTLRQVARYAKVFRKPRAAKVATVDPNQITIGE